MSRTLVSSSSQYLEYAGASVTAVPLTLACWVRPAAASIGAAQAIFYLGNATAGGGNNRFYLGKVSTDQFTINANTSGVNGSTVVSAGVWYHVAGVFTSATARTLFVNGSSEGTNNANTTPSGVNNTTLGARYSAGSLGLYFDGEVAEATVWNVALSAGEIASLAAGAWPPGIQAANLVDHWILAGFSSPEPNAANGNAMVVNGGAAGAPSIHPPVWRPWWGNQPFGGMQ